MKNMCVTAKILVNFPLIRVQHCMRAGRHFTGLGREKLALKITICRKNKQFSLKLTFLV